MLYLHNLIKDVMGADPSKVASQILVAKFLGDTPKHIKARFLNESGFLFLSAILKTQQVFKGLPLTENTLFCK